MCNEPEWRVAVRNAAGKIVMECVIETKASMILQFFDGLRGDLHVTFEEGTWAAWLYDLLKPHVTRRRQVADLALLSPLCLQLGRNQLFIGSRRTGRDQRAFTIETPL